MKKLMIVLACAGLLGAGAALEAQEKKGNRSIVRFGRDVTIEAGTSVRNAVSVGGSVTVNGRVEKDAVSVGGSVVLGPNAEVGHNAVSVGGEVRRDATAVVRGDIVEFTGPDYGRGEEQRPVRHRNWFAVAVTARIVSLIGFIALAMLIAAVLPKPVAAVASIIEEKPLPSLLWGLLGFVLIVPVMILLAVSVVGILLIPVEIVFVVIAMLAGFIAAGSIVGKRIIAALGKPPVTLLWETFWGVLILGLAGLIPIFGWLASLLAALVGFGAVLVALFSAHVKKTPTPA